jgi:predicted RNA binding protein YcfA (HicA-like mRNA interferase family)
MEKASPMPRRNKLMERILRGTSDTNIPFKEMCQLLRSLGFAERIRGSHHIFTKEGIMEILNLQPKDANAKPYQVKQVRNVILKYKLGEAEDGKV